MSAIDINSVAGFKAVDAEGNELGIMSMADITAAVKESIMQDAAMARSVATLSEASTLAATDTYEDQLPQQTDLKWARGLDANGNPILISKESFASVVGGLPQKGLIDNVDVDTLTSQGSYYLRNNITNAPDWSYLIVIQVLNKENIIQINMLANGTLVKIRARASSGWGTWRDLLAQM